MTCGPPGLVVATGVATEIGKISGLLSSPNRHHPAPVKIADFTRMLIIAILIVGAVNFGLGTLRRL